MPHPDRPPFQDPDLPADLRTADLLDRLTTKERIGLLHQYQAPIPRLGVQPFRTGTEALHGLAWLGRATVFPQVVGLAATWDTDLVRRVGEAVADEVLASHEQDPTGAGRNVWAPVVNPLRDPRWGRNEEGWSEDPWLTGLLSRAYARGLAGDGPTLRLAPTLKHFLGYNNEEDRCTTSSDLPPRVLHEYELPAHLPALRDGSAVGVMPSYNLVNGRPAHLSPLIDEVLRPAAPDPLLVVSDAHAPGNLAGLQAFHPDLPTAYAHAIRAGLDSFTQDDADPEATLEHIEEALRRGLLTEDDIARAAGRALSLRVRLGEFDPAPPRARRTVADPAHRPLAREAAARSFVLLRNSGLLPLQDVRSVAVIGQLGDTLMEDWYSGTLPYTFTARAGVAERVDTVFCEGADRVTLHAPDGPIIHPTDGGPPRVGGNEETASRFALLDWGGGAVVLRSEVNGLHLGEGPEGAELVCESPGPNQWEVRETFRIHHASDGTVTLTQIHTGRAVTVADDGTLYLTEGPGTPLRIDGLGTGATEAARVAAEADVCVVVAGDHPMVNGRETEDRTDLDLPAAQENVLRAVHRVNPDTVLVLSSGYPFAVTWADENLPALLWSAHGGQEYGRALADVLFGDVEPAGRLTQTWYRSVADLPDPLDYDIVSAGSTYLYFEGDPLYPFGHGLGHASVDYTEPLVRVADGRVTVEVLVTNTGTRPAEEVVQVYTRQLTSRFRTPLRALRGFSRVSVAPGGSTLATVTFDVDQLVLWDTVRDRFVVEDAARELLIGRSATDIRATMPLTVPGETIPPRDAHAGPWSAVGYDAAHATALCPLTAERGDAVRATRDGAWIAFHDVDLGPGTSEVHITANTTRQATVRVRLDDREKGPVVAEIGVLADPDPYAFTEFRAPAEGAHGTRDVYLHLEEGTAVAELGVRGT